MHFTTAQMTVLAFLTTLTATHPTAVEKRFDCGPSSQYYKPGPNCENTLYPAGSAPQGGYDCGAASQYYKPGPHCENTLYTAGNATTPATGAAGANCGPASQYYQPGPNCANLLYTNVGGGSDGGATSPGAGTGTGTGPGPQNAPAVPAPTGGFDCGPASQYYKPGPHCENTLWTS